MSPMADDAIVDNVVDPDDTTADDTTSTASDQAAAADNVTPIRQPDEEGKTPPAEGDEPTEKPKILGRWESEQDALRYLAELEQYKQAREQEAQAEQAKRLEQEQMGQIDQYRQAFREEFKRRIETGDHNAVADLFLDVVMDTAAQTPIQVQQTLAEQMQQEEQFRQLQAGLMAEPELEPIRPVVDDIVQMGRALQLPPEGWEWLIGQTLNMAQKLRPGEQANQGKRTRQRDERGRYMADVDDGGSAPASSQKGEGEDAFVERIVKDFWG